MSAEVIAEIRELKTEKSIKEGQIRELSRILKEHQAKPKSGESSVQMQAKWLSVKEPIEKQRQGLIQEVKDLQEDITEARKDLDQSPLDGRTISMVIDRLVEIEASFTVDGHAEAWDRLTSLTDWLEELEASA